MTEPEPPPRKPFEIPKLGVSMLSGAYAVFGAGVLGAYLLSGIFGWGAGGDEERDVLPASVRQAPGGYRGYHLWHSGYQGGK